MTTTRTTSKPSNCIDCNKKLSSKNRSQHDDLCTICFDLAGLENEHQDGMHEDEPVTDCLMCDPEARTQHVDREGHTNTAPKTHTSHKGHDHPATPKARAACRKARDAKA